MATKKPLVLTAGQREQIQAGDTLDPTFLATGTPDGTKFLRDDGAWAAASGGVSDGDKGDVVVSSGVWTLENWLKRSTALNIGIALGSPIVANGLVEIDKITTSNSLVSQTARYYAVWIPFDMTITGVRWWQATLGNYTANNYNGVGLYSFNGTSITLVASSTDDGTIWKATSNTWTSKAFSSTYVATAGLYFIAALYCSSAQTTAPAIGAAAGTPTNLYTPTGSYPKPNGISAGSVTSLTSPITFSSGVNTSPQMIAFFLY